MDANILSEWNSLIEIKGKGFYINDSDSFE